MPAVAERVARGLDARAPGVTARLYHAWLSEAENVEATLLALVRALVERGQAAVEALELGLPLRGVLDLRLLQDAVQVLVQPVEEEAQELLRVVLLRPRELRRVAADRSLQHEIMVQYHRGDGWVAYK